MATRAALVEGLNILQRLDDGNTPVVVGPGVICVAGVDRANMNEHDKAYLDRLKWRWDEDEKKWHLFV